MSVYLSLVQHLQERRELIVKRWLEATMRSSNVESADDVSLTQLRDHVPALLNDLLERLLNKNEVADGETTADADAHGYFRWQQGYDLSDVLTELGLLRGVLIDELNQFPMPPGTDSGPARAVHNFMDEVVRISAIRFAEQQQAALHQLSESRMGLLRTVSHEVRNAVNAIQLNLAVLRGEDEVEQQQQCNEALDRAVNHLRDLLNSLLDFSQLAEGGLQAECAKIDPRDLAKELAEPYHKVCRELGLAFHVEVDPTLEPFESDLTKLRQIGSNLLGNAIKYTTVGRIALCLRSVDSDNWSLAVSDTGMGISQEAQEHLFEEFYRVPGTEKIHGTGLGLAICKRLVELLGGVIRVESKEGHGSTFEAVLPKHR